MSKNFYDLIKNEDEELITVIQTAPSITSVLRHYDISVTNNHARKALKDFIKEANIELSSYEPNARYGVKRTTLTLEEVKTKLVNGEKNLGTALRRYILLFDLLPYKCATDNCLLSDSDNLIWNGKEIKLDLDHINGNNKDNRLENLRFLCPNCHSQTETYKGRNSRKNELPAIAIVRDPEKKSELYSSLPSPEEIRTRMLKENVSVKSMAGSLGLTKYALYQYLKGDLKPSLLKHEWGTKEEVIAQVAKLGWEATGRQYNVSGNAVRKYLKNRGVDPKTVPTPHKTGPKRKA